MEAGGIHPALLCQFRLVWVGFVQPVLEIALVGTAPLFQSLLRNRKPITTKKNGPLCKTRNWRKRIKRRWDLLDIKSPSCSDQVKATRKARLPFNTNPCIPERTVWNTKQENGLRLNNEPIAANSLYTVSYVQITKRALMKNARLFRPELIQVKRYRSCALFICLLRKRKPFVRKKNGSRCKTRWAMLAHQMNTLEEDDFSFNTNPYMP